MTTQLPIFVDCPYGGCEDGYCACLEQDLDPEDFDGSYDGLDLDELDEETRQMLADLLAGRAMVRRSRFRRIETVPVSIDTYTPPGGDPCPP